MADGDEDREFPNAPRADYAPTGVDVPAGCVLPLSCTGKSEHTPTSMPLPHLPNGCGSAEPLRQVASARGAERAPDEADRLAIRASNVVWETPEGRRFFKLRPLQIFITLLMILLLTLVLLSVVLTGPVVEAVAGPLGIGDTAVSIWNIAKWPVLLVVVMLMFGVLYHFAPNAKMPSFKFVSLGAIFAVVVWIIASALLRLLHRELRLLPQDLRHPRRGGRPARVGVDHQRRPPPGHGDQRGARALRRARRGRSARRAGDPARTPRHPQTEGEHLMALRYEPAHV